MITLEMLNNQAGLNGLTDEQKQVIVTLSKNDENAVIGAKFGEVYRQLDESIKEATGIDRNGDEKTYLYLKRAATEYANKYKDYDSLKSQITTLTTEKAELEAKIAAGAADSELKTQLENVKKELQTTKDQFNTLKAEKDSMEAKHKDALLGMRIDGEMARAKEGLKFKAGLSEAAIKTLLDQAILKVKSNSPKFEGEEGKEILHFFDANGVIMNNPNNSLNPYTAKELLVKELTALDVLDKAARTGAGGREITPPGAGAYSAATQIEAMEVISKDLLAKGFVKGTPKYDAELQKIWDENQINLLPLQ